ncbi:MAG: type II toxin-antitoxin system RelE/ParE family toxin [Bacteroidota bacterium]
MSYNIFTIPPFDRQLKRLAKKYPSLKSEYANLIEILEQKPEQGTNIGYNCYKIRLAIASKGKGKSGGARVIANVAIADDSVFLLSIYDKSEQTNISDKELVELIKYIAE